MPFFTQSGIVKLQAFQKEVVRIQAKFYEAKGASSAYSRNMAAEALKIIAFMIARNNDTILTKGAFEKLVAQIQSSIDVIDNETNTAIPTIFNQQSLELAQAFSNFLRGLDLNTDAGTQIQFFFKLKSLSSGGDSNTVLKQFAEEIDANIRIYEAIANAQHYEKGIQDLQQEITKAIGEIWRNWKPHPPAAESLLGRLQKGEFATRDDFLKVYSPLMEGFLQRMEALPFVQLRYISQYVNTTKPYTLDPGDVGTKDYGKWALDALRTVETDVNTKLAEKGWAPVEDLQAWGRAMFTAEKVAAHKTEIGKLYAEFKAAAKKYEKGAHLAFYQSVDPQKKGIVGGVVTAIDQSWKERDAKSDAFSKSVLDVYKKAHKEAVANAELAKKQKIGLGECASLLRAFEARFLVMAMMQPWGASEHEYMKFHLEAAVQAKPKGKEGEREFKAGPEAEAAKHRAAGLSGRRS